MNSQITYEEVRELFDYDAETGVFTNRVDRSLSARKGEVAGGLNKTTGYWRIRENGKSYQAHRLAWLYVYLPEHGLDHKNRIRHHNWIENLREATSSCNIKNSKIKNNNVSGITGVYWYKRYKKWAVTIHDKSYKRIFIGYFTSKLEAANARYNAEIEHDYPNCNTQSSALKYIQQKENYSEYC